MGKRQNKDKVKFWRAEDLGNVDLLNATYIQQIFSRHIHEEYSLGMIEAGGNEFYYRGETHLAAQGQVFVIQPGEVHTGHSYLQSGFRYRAFYPSIEQLQQIQYQLTGKWGQPPYFPKGVIQDPELARQIQSLHQLLEYSDFSLERETSFILILARLIERHATKHSGMMQPGREPAAIQQVRDYLADHYQENVTLDALSQLTGLSSYYLARTFSKTVGMPPHAYLNQVRVHRAKAFLQAGISIQEVALETGFSDQSHLTRHFKKFLGMTPGQCRG